MLDPVAGRIVQLDHEFRFSPSGGDLFLVQQEETHRCYAVGVGYSPAGGFSTPATALITVWGVVQAIFGYPGEEAFTKDPRGSLGSICEVVDSTWKEKLADYDRRVFGSSSAEQVNGEKYFEPPSLPPLHHYFLGSKDVSAQFLGRDLLVDVYRDVAFEDVVQDALRRLRTWTPPPWEWQ